MSNERAQPATQHGLPELPVVDTRPPLPESLRPAFDQFIGEVNELFGRVIEYARTHNTKSAVNLLAPADADHLWSYLCGRTEDLPAAAAYLEHNHVVADVGDELFKFFLNDAITPAHILRALGLVKQVKAHGEESLAYRLVRALNRHYQNHKRPTLLEVEALVATVGLDAGAVSRAYRGSGLAGGWDDADVWPFFARHMDMVRDWLRLEIPEGWHNHAMVFNVLARFPEPPAEIVPRLFEIALGSAREDGALAQDALERFADRDARIVAALGDGKAVARAAAARWLGRIKCLKAVPALEAALRRETNDACIDAIMSALEALGMRVDVFLDRDKLAQEAAKGLAKGMPAALAWFPWDALPEVRWASPSSRPSPKGEGEQPPSPLGEERSAPSPLGEGRGEGDVVPREVVQWLVVQATRLKTPQPHSMLRRYAATIVAADRARLGQFVLEAWMAEDVKAIDLALPVYKRATGHSAIDSKGLLAIAAACCDREAAPAAGRYLKDYYGTRAGQCKALIVMLAWVDHPSATQLMLSVGHRFRTKGIQDEAQHQAELLAERRGWTVAELADRTIPTAGFEEDGTLDLSYGARKLTARIGEQFKLELYNEDDKKIAALPEPRQDDDAAVAANAKKALAAAKKDLKTIVQLQGDRLYEALCTQRRWRFEDWERYLNRHAVVRRLLQGLVWAQLHDGKVVATFRPLDDGTLTGVSDEPVTIAPDAEVCLAHDTNLDPAQVVAWQKHLADYEVAAPFAQLGKGTYALPAELEGANELADFVGHVLGSFALRGRAVKLGYQRGPTEDGGWFYEYRKRFPTLAVEAVIRFTGNEMPETNREVALQTLAFTRNGGPDASSKVPLAALPAVLLSECYNDMRLIAAEGRGFDPDWGRLEG